MAVTTRSMPCPICGASTRVPQTLPVKDGEVRRIRECSGARKHKFHTREVFVADVVPRAFSEMGKARLKAAAVRRHVVTKELQRELFEDIAVRIARAIVDKEAGK